MAQRRGRSENRSQRSEETDTNEIGMKRCLDENVVGAGLGAFEMEVGISKDDLRAASASKASNDGQVSLYFFVLLFE